MRLVRGRPLVDVRINGGGPYPFLLDTGAAGDARADAGLVEKLKLPVVGESRGGAPGGQVVTMPIVQFDTIEIGAAKWAPVAAAPAVQFVPPFPHANLGIALLSQFALTVDQKNKRVRFAHDGSAPIVLKPRAERGH